jgi:antitoxin HicB
MLSYPIDLTPDEDGTFLATCPDLPELTTFGMSEADALAHADDALAEAVAARLHDFAEIPRPSSGMRHARLSLHMTMIVELYWALAALGWTRADLQRALGWHRPQVDRLFDPNNETKLWRFEAAFAALGREPEITTKVA